MPSAEVRVIVERWMASHQNSVDVWNAFDVQDGLEVIVSIRQCDGVRRLTLTDEQDAQGLAPEVEARILRWLDNLSTPPTIQA